MANEVKEGRLDLAFVSLPGGAPPGIELIPLASEQIMLAVPVAHPLAQLATVELVQLRDETIVDFPEGWGIRMAVDRSFAAAGLTRMITYEVNDMATLINFIRNGLAIGLLPRSNADTTGQIAFVPIRDQPPQFQTAIAIPSNRRLSAATLALLDTIKHHTRLTPAHTRRARGQAAARRTRGPPMPCGTSDGNARRTPADAPGVGCLVAPLWRRCVRASRVSRRAPRGPGVCGCCEPRRSRAGCATAPPAGWRQARACRRERRPAVLGTRPRCRRARLRFGGCR